MLEKMETWLQTFPGWEGAVQIDYADATPGSFGMYPQGVKELSRREDVLGNTAVRCRVTFLLRRAACPGKDSAQWLLDLQRWVMEQSRLGLAPKFGDEPRSEGIRAEQGKLEKSLQVGSGFYTVLLHAEFTKLYEVK